jgi:hypothetical protein
MEMTITRALNELKLLESRLGREISNGVFIACKKNSAAKVNNVYAVEEFNTLARSTVQSIESLIARKKFIKEAVVASNAVTVLTVSGKTMTVASAIERKNSIEYEKQLLRAMERSYNAVLSELNTRNDQVNLRRDEMVKSMGGKDKVTAEFISTISKQYDEENGWVLVDPLHLGDKIAALRKEIEDFENEVDFALSEINAITRISIPDVIN